MGDAFKAIVALTEVLKDPLVLILVLAILVSNGILLLVVHRLFKMVLDKEEYSRHLVEQLGKNTNTLTNLVTLVEVLVWGRKKPNHESE